LLSGQIWGVIAMTATFKCPECGLRGPIKEEMPPGAKLRCPDCQTLFPVKLKVSRSKVLTEIDSSRSPIASRSSCEITGSEALTDGELNQGTGDSRFLIASLCLALVAMVVGIVFVDMHFARERREEATRKLSEEMQVARQQIDQRNWNDAIKLLKQIKTSANAAELNDQGKELLAGADALLIDSERTVEKIRADHVLESAEQALRLERWSDAQERLRHYLASPEATHRPKATLLLKAIDLIDSAKSAVEFLCSLTEPEFANFAEQGSLPSLDLTDFDLLQARCLDSLNENLSEAQSERETRQKLREESERLAASNQTRDQSAVSTPSSTTGSGLSYSSPRSSSSRRSPGTEVHVRGYTRKDGTYVRPHTRSAPRRR
jgi:hypothetical protein